MEDDPGEARSARAERRRELRRRRAARTATISAAAAGAFFVVALAVLAWLAFSPQPLTGVRHSPMPGIAAAATRLPVERAAKAAIELGRSETITVIAVGDLLFDIAPRRLIAAQGGKAPLAKVASYMRNADLTIANLEGPLSNRGTKVAGKPDNLIFEGDPRATESLNAAGVDVVTLANNHTMDYGPVALKDTLKYLDKAKVRYSGAGLNVKKAWTPVVMNVKGNKVAYLSATQVLPAHFLAGSNTPGVANGDDVSRMVKAIRSAKKKYDYVIVSFHWGVEQSYGANSSQVSQARRCIDAGADMVLSHHPHVMQGIEFYKGRLIAYSLGNFVFPYKTIEGRKSFVLKAQVGPGGVKNVTAWPVYLGEWGRPSHQTGSSAKGILAKLATTSKRHGTKLVVKGDIAKVVPD